MPVTLRPFARLVALVGITALLAGIIPAAQAHNVLRLSDPKDRATVPAPAHVALTFDQSVQTLGTAVRVDGPQGPLDLEPLTVDGQTVVQPMPEGLAAGEYTVLWRATSSDGHPIDGTVTFTATAAGSPKTTLPPTTAGTHTSGPSTSSGPSTQPQDAGTDGAQPVSVDSDAGGPSSALWLGVAALVLVLAAAALWLRRRDRTPPA